MSHPSQSDSPAPQLKKHPNDFKFGKEIGLGSFSQVILGREIETGNEFAIKVVEKARVKRNRAIETVMMEKEVLRRTSHPFIVKLYFTFQDDERLYYVLSYAKRGEILKYLTELTSFNLECTRHYIAEVFLAIQYLHEHNIVHRDLKPENILLSTDMHIKLCDFGSAIILDAPQVKAPGFTGTPQYVSPEMLNYGGVPDADQKASTPGDPDSDPSCSADFSLKVGGGPCKELYYLMDFWALGCILYQFLAGLPPFRVLHPGGMGAAHEYEIFQKVLSLDYSFPDGFEATAQDLVTQLLVLNPSNRLGSPTKGGHTAVREHNFFSGIIWDRLPESTPPVLMPNLHEMNPVDWEKVPIGYEEGIKYQVVQEIAELPEDEKRHLLRAQRLNNPYNNYAKGRLILKQGFLFKRRGLFARKRLFLLTEGPHLYYVDVDAGVVKGEVPWTSLISFEFKSSKLFSIVTPSRTYYLEDPSGGAQEWLNKLKEIKEMYFVDEDNSPAPDSGDSYRNHK